MRWSSLSSSQSETASPTNTASTIMADRPVRHRKRSRTDKGLIGPQPRGADHPRAQALWQPSSRHPARQLQLLKKKQEEVAIPLAMVRGVEADDDCRNVYRYYKDVRLWLSLSVCESKRQTASGRKQDLSHASSLCLFRCLILILCLCQPWQQQMPAQQTLPGQSV